MLKERQRKGMDCSKWKTAEDVFKWWMQDENMEGQMRFEDYGKEDAK